MPLKNNLCSSDVPPQIYLLLDLTVMPSIKEMSGYLRDKHFGL